MNPTIRKPFLPGDLRRSAGQPLIRAASAFCMGCARGWEESRSRWSDNECELVLKAATSPASTTVANWAGSLASTSLVDFIGSLGPASAGAQLLQRGLQLQFEGHNALVVPALLPFTRWIRARGQPNSGEAIFCRRRSNANAKKVCGYFIVQQRDAAILDTEY
jgi:hypothetical protein